MPRLPSLLFTLILLSAPVASATYHQIDLAQLSTDTGELLRVYGADGNGAFGVPVAGGKDCDGDGFADYALAEMLASPLGRDRAGSVLLVFGDGQINGTVDAAQPQPRVLRLVGSGRQENTGNEIWIDDVTGDGIADLLIGRQNFSFTTALTGNGAVSIVVGGPLLKTLAAAGAIVDLRQPPPELTVVTLIGGQRMGRLGMYVRSGDVTGDGIAELIASADQEDHIGQQHSGAVYVVRGGPHLAASQIISLGDLASSALSGHLARIDAIDGQPHIHFGATCATADLDNDGRSEVLIAAALNRAGGVLSPSGAGGASSDGVGGTLHGSLYIAWAENFPTGAWPEDFHFAIDASPAAHTIIDGGERNAKFGEEMVGGLDYDVDGRADLFVGDLTADLSPAMNHSDSGAGYVLYDAAQLRGLTFAIDAAPVTLRLTVITGEIRGAITGDTAIDGDFDGDGRADLALGSPHAAPLGRQDAGVLHILFGQPGGWPAQIDVSALASLSTIRSAEVVGAFGQADRNDGDVLGYSVAAGDVNRDGRTDLIVNEMEGDGVSPKTIDVGNLLVLDGNLIGSGKDSVECPPLPLSGCLADSGSRLRLRHPLAVAGRRARWRWRGASGPPADATPPPALSYAWCVYDGSSSQHPVIALELASPEVCPHCWSTPVAGTWRYLDPAPPTAGMRWAVFRSGTRRRPSIELFAEDWRSSTVERSFEPPVTAQLIAGDGHTTTCWQSVYSAGASNTAANFTAAAP